MSNGIVAKNVVRKRSYVEEHVLEKGATEEPSASSDASKLAQKREDRLKDFLTQDQDVEVEDSRQSS